MALYNWLLMLSRVVLNALIQIKRTEPLACTRIHTFTTPRLRCTLRNRYCSLFSVNEAYLSSEWQLETSQAPPPLQQRGGRWSFKQSALLATRGSWTLAFVHRVACVGGIELPWAHRLDIVCLCLMPTVVFVERSAPRMRISFVLLLW